MMPKISLLAAVMVMGGAGLAAGQTGPWTDGELIVRSVLPYAEQLALPADPESIERLARYVTRAPIRLDALRPLQTGQVAVQTPPDPRTGATELVLDPLDWVHAITTQIPDPGQHLVRYYGFYACRTRGARSASSADTHRLSPDPPNPPQQTTAPAFRIPYPFDELCRETYIHSLHPELVDIRDGDGLLQTKKVWVDPNKRAKRGAEYYGRPFTYRSAFREFRDHRIPYQRTGIRPVRVIE